MSLMAIIKFGYALVVVTLLLMIWASLSGALELHADTGHPPCLFQALCTCSKPAGDLGIVTCKHVPILRVPAPINSSKVFSLELNANKIVDLEPQFFQATGLYRLAINHNPLESVHEEAFYGLDNTLWELELRFDKLTTVPSRSLRYLQKLRLLDLAGNEITDISGDNWRGLENTLQTLVLSDNSIASLPLDAFTGLPMLETLDLHGNHLSVIDPGVFRDGMSRLNRLVLGDNQLSYIPYEEISPLRQLRFLDLSNNLIKQVPPNHELNGIRLSLDSLKLDNNRITVLFPAAFKYFNILNSTTLDGNPIYSIREDAFRNAKIKTLSLRDCEISELSPASFAGLENSLQSLDLAENNLTSISKFMLNKLDSLRFLNLKENKVDLNLLTMHMPSEYAATTVNNFQYKLFYLDVSGANSIEMSLQEFRRMRSLRYLSVSKLIRQSIRAEDFLEFGVELEDLKIFGSTINRIESSAFQHVRTIKTLDLSENNVEFIDPFAFAELHSLTTLKMANGLADTVKIVPFEPLKALIELQYLDLSNNRLKNVPDTSFHFLYKLKTLNLQDNYIDHFSKGTLQGDIHGQLQSVWLSQNLMHQIVQHTFVDLKELQEILMEDNLIESIHRRAFTSLDNLNIIRLKGNRIVEISEEAFQNIPALKELDISFNQLETFKFSIFDQVGSATALKVNASYNRIFSLTDSNAPSFFSSNFYPPPKAQISKTPSIPVPNQNIRPGSVQDYYNNPANPSNPEYRDPNYRTNAEYPSDPNYRDPNYRYNSNYRSNDYPLSPSYRANPDYHYNPDSPNTPSYRSNSDYRLNSEYRPDSEYRSNPDYRSNPEYRPDSDYRANSEYRPNTNYRTNTDYSRLNHHSSGPGRLGTVSVNIRVLDFSHNNVTYIAPYYFRHADLTLSELHLSHNLLRNITREVFGSLHMLQLLDLSHNHIFDMEYDCFNKVKNLQIINLSHNYLLEMPVQLFHEMQSLTIVDLSYNRIRNLPDNFFPSPLLEKLDLSNNAFSRIPTNALSMAAAANLVELDLSGNTIPAISMSDLVQRFRNEQGDWSEEPDYSDEYMYHTVRRDHTRVFSQKKQYPQNILYKSLAWLDLSDNHLVRIEGGSFSALPRLRWLDLSNNLPFNNGERSNSLFKGLERKLSHLGLKNVSLSSLPPMSLPKLKSLDLSYNNLPSIPPDTTANLTRLRTLDLSYNDLTTIPVATHSLSELRWLSLSGNPITALMNTSLYGVSPRLEYLDVTKLYLRIFEYGVFSKMYALRTLKISSYSNIRDFNVPRMLHNNAALENLLIEVDNGGIEFGKEMYGALPYKLNNITITGRALVYLTQYLLSGIQSKSLRLTVYNTSVEEVAGEVFWRPGRLKNLTLDVRGNYITRVPNPGQKEWPGVPNNVFLHDILVAGNPLACDCGIGWIEAWDRKRRQYLCSTPSNCVSTRDDSRFATCPTWYNRTLIDVIKQELDCDWSKGFLQSPNTYIILGSTVLMMLWF